MKTETFGVGVSSSASQQSPLIQAVHCGVHKISLIDPALTDQQFTSQYPICVISISYYTFITSLSYNLRGCEKCLGMFNPNT
jgi:hypothetical protein